MRKKIFFCFFFASAFLFSCGKKNDEPIVFETGKIIEAEDAGSDAFLLQKETQTWHVSPDCICILLGYGYNNKDFVEPFKEKIFAKYGNALDGGFVRILVFPDDFRRASKSVAAELPLFFEEKNLCGFITLGAPENTHFGLAHVFARYDDEPPFSTFAFFPQDDLPGTEGTADIVLDREQKADIDGVIESEEEQTFVKAAPIFIERAIPLMKAIGTPLSQNDTETVLKKIVGKTKVKRYIDAQTGLQSINHFVMNQ